MEAFGPTLTPGSTQALALRGDVVQILREPGGRRLMKIDLGVPRFLEVVADVLPDVHLGDPVVIDARIRVIAARRCMDERRSTE